MSLIACPECQNEVSDKANACPKCGFPVAELEIHDCPECGESVTKDDETCPNCGFPLSEPEVPDCPECGEEVSVDDDICPHCGFPIAKATAEQANGTSADTAQDTRRAVPSVAIDRRLLLPL